MRDEKSYEDIRNIVYPVKTDRPRMSMHDRAAQFSPFAALTGFDALVGETARLTQTRIELDETEKAELDRAMCELQVSPGRKIALTYFLRDSRKDGGAYLSVSGCMKKIDEINRSIVMDDKTIIPIEDVISLRFEE